MVNASGQNIRFDFVAVVIGMEVNSVLVQVLKQRGGNLGQLGFGITIGCRRITIDGAEVPLPEHQRIAQAPFLRKPYQSIVDRDVAVRMVLAHYVSDDTGAVTRG